MTGSKKSPASFYITILSAILCQVQLSTQEPCRMSLLRDETAIPDRSFSAQSELMQDGGYKSARARLDNKYNIPWKAGKLDKHQYIQVDLGVPAMITAVRTQGCGIIGICKEWVTKYRLFYSLDGQHWMTYSDSKTGQIIELDGNKDAHHVVETSLQCQVIARYVRVVPLEWNNYISMKIDFLGCPLNLQYSNPLVTGIHVNSTSTPVLHEPYPGITGPNGSSLRPQPSQALTIASAGSSIKPVYSNDCLGGLGKLSCWGMADGDYQHCVSCRRFIKCSNYNLFEFACPSKLLWDDKTKACTYISSTCNASI